MFLLESCQCGGVVSFHCIIRAEEPNCHFKMSILEFSRHHHRSSPCIRDDLLDGVGASFFSNDGGGGGGWVAPLTDSRTNDVGEVVFCAVSRRFG